jgi:hypothetical protein
VLGRRGVAGGDVFAAGGDGVSGDCGGDRGRGGRGVGQDASALGVAVGAPAGAGGDGRHVDDVDVGEAVLGQERDEGLDLVAQR